MDTISIGLKTIVNKQINDYIQSTESDNSSIISAPFVYTTPTLINTNKLSPFVSYNRNNATFGYYSDLNKDKTVHKTITKYFYYKIMDKWFYKDLLPLLAFIKIDSSKKPNLIKSMNDYSIGSLANDTKNELEIKINYMEKILITKDMVKHVLKKIIHKYNLNWYTLNKYNDLIKKYFYKYIKEKLETAIQNI